ncbi:MAG TPA: ABC transporter permease, partial [Alkalispirochaeta sp.]|nr:ABC transporter permease [Alkalispirochaeta sp.]
MMREMAAMAWRNVWRNRRRTTLNVTALSVGMGILVLALGWIGGYHTYIYDTLRDFQTGEVQVMHSDWYSERTRLPVDLLVEDYESVRERVAGVRGVRGVSGQSPAVTGRVLFSVRISTGRRSWRAMATAVDVRHEPKVGVLGEHVIAGRRVADMADAASSGDSGRRGLWIGRPVAEKAGVSPGDILFLRAVNRHGVENLFDVPVAGVFEYGYPALDEQMVYVDLATADELLDLDGAVTHVVARVTEGTGVAGAVARIAAELGDARDLQVRPWHDFARAAVTAVEQDTNSFILMISIMYLLIVLGIVNSMSMSVHERTREIGTMRAIGMKGRSLLAM